jgi:hypothetical protein
VHVLAKRHAGKEHWRFVVIDKLARAPISMHVQATSPTAPDPTASSHADLVWKRAIDIAKRRRLEHLAKFEVDRDRRLLDGMTRLEHVGDRWRGHASTAAVVTSLRSIFRISRARQSTPSEDTHALV